MRLPPVLTIAGSDSSGGAGIQADLKAFTALGTYGMSVITALTAQNTQRVEAVWVVPPEFVRVQLDAVFADIVPLVIKTGMLATAEVICEVQDFIERKASKVPLVVDPILVATSGAPLLAPTAEEALRQLCKVATVVTPNLPEAAVLAGKEEPLTEADAHLLGETLSSTYPRPYWLLKGGHASWEKGVVTSWLFRQGRLIQRFRQPRIALPRPPHGTGCTLAAAIAAYLAHGEEVPVAVLGALDFVHRSLQRADLSLGRSAVVLNPVLHGG